MSSTAMRWHLHQDVDSALSRPGVSYDSDLDELFVSPDSVLGLSRLGDCYCDCKLLGLDSGESVHASEQEKGGSCSMDL
jgi:hypothetical protein